MDNPIIIPTVTEIKEFLDLYGWKYREVETGEGQTAIISPYTLEKEAKGVLLSFRVEGEFVMVSTVGFLKKVPVSFSNKILELNDTVKLVKLFSVETKENAMDIELGFELWAEAWNKVTFCVFMDMLCIGIESILDKVTQAEIAHETEFVIYEKPAEQASE